MDEVGSSKPSEKCFASKLNMASMSSVCVTKRTEQESRQKFRTGDLVLAIRSGAWHEAEVAGENLWIIPETGVVVPRYLIHFRGFDRSCDDFLLAGSLMLHTPANKARADAENCRKKMASDRIANHYKTDRFAKKREGEGSSLAMRGVEPIGPAQKRKGTATLNIPVDHDDRNDDVIFLGVKLADPVASAEKGFLAFIPEKICVNEKNCVDEKNWENRPVPGSSSTVDFVGSVVMKSEETPDEAHFSRADCSTETDNAGSTMGNDGSAADPDAVPIPLARLAVSGNDGSREFLRTLTLQERARLCRNVCASQEEARGFMHEFSQMLGMPVEHEADVVMDDTLAVDAVQTESEAKHPNGQIGHSSKFAFEDVGNSVQLPDSVANEEPEKSNQGCEVTADLAAVPVQDVSSPPGTERLEDALPTTAKVSSYSQPDLRRRRLRRCPSCPCIRVNKGDLDHHMKGHENSYALKCPFLPCNWTTERPSGLALHIKMHKTAAAARKDAEDSLQLSDGASNEVPEKFDDRLVDDAVLPDHVNPSSSSVERLGRHSQSGGSPQQPGLHKPGRGRRCPSCPFIYNGKGVRERHMKGHENSFDIKCPFTPCTWTCNHYSSLAVHTKMHIAAGDPRKALAYVSKRSGHQRKKMLSSAGQNGSAKKCQPTGTTLAPSLPVVAETPVDFMAQSSTGVTAPNRSRRSPVRGKRTKRPIARDSLNSAISVRQRQTSTVSRSAATSASPVVQKPSAPAVASRSRSLSTSRRTIPTQRSHSFPRTIVDFFPCTEPGCRFKGSRTLRGLSAHIGYSHRPRSLCTGAPDSVDENNQRGLPAVNYFLRLADSIRLVGQVSPPEHVSRSPAARLKSILQMKPLVKQVAAHRSRIWFCESMNETIEFDVHHDEEPPRIREKRKKVSSKKPRKKLKPDVLDINWNGEAGIKGCLKSGNGPVTNEHFGEGSTVPALDDDLWLMTEPTVRAGSV